MAKETKKLLKYSNMETSCEQDRHTLLPMWRSQQATNCLYQKDKQINIT